MYCVFSYNRRFFISLTIEKLIESSNAIVFWLIEGLSTPISVSYTHLLLKAGAVAFNLQGDLLMLNKQVYTNISYSQQIQYIVAADEDDLIIIFSYTGAYFDYQDLRALKKRLTAPKIWMISSDDREYPECIDRTILFKSLQDQNSHPYQLQFIAGLIAQEYSRLHQLK